MTDLPDLHGGGTANAAEASAVGLSLGGNTVLAGVNLQLPSGAVLGLVGRNGAGKSALLCCLVGLAAPATGHCTLLGAPSLDLPDAVRARLGYVAQQPDLLDWLTGMQHLQRIGTLYPGWDSDRALLLATQLNLPLGTRAGLLSLGDQQKLSLVLALGHDPELLLLDEPLASLDPVSRRDVMRALFQRADGQPPRTVLISSHGLADLERVVSHLVFMRAGQVQLAGEWDTLAEHLRLHTLPPWPPGAAAPPPLPGELHRCQRDSHWLLLVDTRHSGAGHPHGAQAVGGQALALDDLFAVLNA